MRLIEWFLPSDKETREIIPFNLFPMDYGSFQKIILIFGLY
jgi:hypothetical protein